MDLDSFKICEDGYSRESDCVKPTISLDVSNEDRGNAVDTCPQYENKVTPITPGIDNELRGFPSIKVQVECDDDPNENENSIYVKDKGPHFYPLKRQIVSSPIDPKKLPKAFSSILLPGNFESKDELSKFQRERIKAYVASDLDDQDIDKLAAICDVNHLRTGQELVMPTDYPIPGLVSNQEDDTVGDNLSIVKRYKKRLELDKHNLFPTRLKYRGMKLIPPQQDVTPDPNGEPLKPGKDIIFRIRVYRSFKYHLKERHGRGRHSVLSYDIVMLGQQPLTELRDRIICTNDIINRIDVSEDRENLVNILPTSREVFPSGFLFINNVFYVDDRNGCKDYSKIIRDWCEVKQMGIFPKVDMSTVKMEDLIVKLGHPDVFMHQGNCEHIFVFSEIRLLNATDPLSRAAYPSNTIVSQNQALYCTTCAEFGAKWIVTHSRRVPFDPAFFCDMCLKSYMYVDNKKLDNFKAFAFRGNQISILKPL